MSSLKFYKKKMKNDTDDLLNFNIHCGRNTKMTCHEKT